MDGRRAPLQNRAHHTAHLNTPRWAERVRIGGYPWIHLLPLPCRRLLIVCLVQLYDLTSGRAKVGGNHWQCLDVG